MKPDPTRNARATRYRAAGTLVSVRIGPEAAAILARMRGHMTVREAVESALSIAASRDFYKRRCDALQSWQSKMRDPERTIVCDILANGFTLDPAGNRYSTTPPPSTSSESSP